MNRLELPKHREKNHNMKYGASACGSYSAGEPPQYRQLADEWLLSFDSPNTRGAYRLDADAYFTWCDQFGIDPLRTTPSLADGYRQHLAGRYPKKNATRARHLATVSSWFKFVRARHPDLAVENPFSGTARPKVAKKSATVGLTMEQAVTLFEYAQGRGLREYAIAQVLLSTGMRVSELVNANTWDIRREGDHHTMAITRKGGLDDRIPLPKEAVDAVRAYVGDRTGPILVNRNGGKVTRQQVSREVDRLAAGCGLPRLSPHCLRHTAATVAILSGEPVERVQTMLGHVDIATTMRYYHAANEVENSAVHGLANAYRQARDARQITSMRGVP